MKITIVQSEIETAIKNYISSMFNVKAGVAMEIDLRATRGEQGFMAEIDVQPGATAQLVTETVAKPVGAQVSSGISRDVPASVTTFPRPAPAAPASSAPRTPAEVREMMEKESQAEEGTQGGDESQAEENAKEDAAAGSGAETSGEQPSETGSAESTSGEPAKKPGGRSLFQGLRRPVNQPVG